MIKKSKQIITDAVVVIHAHECSYWNQLCNIYQIALPATILENELFYFSSDKGKKGLNPSHWVKQGMVSRLDAEIDDYEILSKKLSTHFMHAIDAGEKEALAVLMSEKFKDYLFTTADKAAIKALGILGLGSRGISVEELLKQLGSSANKIKLSSQYTKSWFQKNIAEGMSEQHLWLK
jgi:hypothetical protein